MQGNFNLAVFTMKGLLPQRFLQYTTSVDVFLAISRGPPWADRCPGVERQVNHLFVLWMYLFAFSLPLLIEIVNITILKT